MGKNKPRGKKRAQAPTVDAAALAASLPQVETLRDIPSFSDMRIDDAQRAAFDAFIEQLARADAPAASEMQLGCVVRLDRGFPLVATENSTFRAEHSVNFAKARGEGERLLPAVGDAVAVRVAPGHDMGVIERVLPRRTAFERWRGKNRGERQVLAANVDIIFIVQPLGAARDTRELVRDRIARSLVLAYDCGAKPVVVFTKADPLHPRRAGRNVPRCPTPGGRGRARDRDIVGAGDGPRRGTRLHSRRYLRHDFGRIRRGEVDAAQRPVGL